MFASQIFKFSPFSFYYHCLPIPCPISFPVNICLVFGLRGLGPKEGALSRTATHVSHVTHVTLP